MQSNYSLVNSRVLLLCPKKNTFVLRDLEILRSIFIEVDLVVLPTESKLKLIPLLLKSLYQSVFRLRKYNIIASWFVGYHSVLPFVFGKLYGKKTIAFLGGTECHNFPEFNYGNYRKNLYAFVTHQSLRFSDIILPVHESLIFSFITYDKVTFPEQGILAFNKQLNGIIEELYCGFELQKQWDVSTKIPNSFLTVSSQLYGMDYTRKGVDMTILLAKTFPNYSFTIVGNGYSGENLPNLRVLDAISYNELIDVYIKHQFYLQLSVAEGFPNALAEAMLYGCIPIGSSVFGIPFIIGDTGFILNSRSMAECTKLIASVVELHGDKKRELANRASGRIQTHFTFQKRKTNLLSVLNEVFEVKQNADMYA
ncbi:MAG: hypothetical protein RLZZ337_67 [Bacteroidota bacterium]|jgi:glycosyltransferase involved in cell wall biosynthesis